jgi:hypothetical protein
VRPALTPITSASQPPCPSAARLIVIEMFARGVRGWAKRLLRGFSRRILDGEHRCAKLPEKLLKV